MLRVRAGASTVPTFFTMIQSDCAAVHGFSVDTLSCGALPTLPTPPLTTAGVFVGEGRTGRLGTAEIGAGPVKFSSVRSRWLFARLFSVSFVSGSRSAVNLRRYNGAVRLPSAPCLWIL